MTQAATSTPAHPGTATPARTAPTGSDNTEQVHQRNQYGSVRASCSNGAPSRAERRLRERKPSQWRSRSVMGTRIAGGVSTREELAEAWGVSE
jgi:hypothetical protein